MDTHCKPVVYMAKLHRLDFRDAVSGKPSPVQVALRNNIKDMRREAGQSWRTESGLGPAVIRMPPLAWTAGMACSHQPCSLSE